jgi:hypothetical protein
MEDSQGGHALVFFADNLFQIQFQGVAHAGEVEQVLTDFGFQHLSAVFAELPLQVRPDVVPDVLKGTVIGEHLLRGIDLDAPAIGYRPKERSVYPRICFLELTDNIQNAEVPDQILFYVFLKVMTSA